MCIEYDGDGFVRFTEIQSVTNKEKMEHRIISGLFGLIIIVIIVRHISGDDLGLLSTTLRAFRQMSCEDELITLSCPIGTSISVELVQYGRKEDNSSSLQCTYTNALDAVSRSSLYESTTMMADMPFVLGNLTFSLMESNAINESSLPERTKSKCVQNYVLQYSILQIVVEACQKKRKCSFRASPKSFESTPCPGIHKLVEVSHKCRPYEFRSLIACEKDVIRLACGRYTRVAIYSASYGRTAYESGHCSQPPGSKEETCLSSHTSLTLTEICHGRRKCTVAIEGSTFGQPCPENVRVSLKVVYACVSRNVFRDRYITPLENDELDQQFELNELYDDEFTPAPNQVDESSASNGGQMSHKFSGELEATVKAENILTQSKDGTHSVASIDNRLLVIVVVGIFFGCCLSIGAIVAYKMRLLSATDNACIKHHSSESSEPQSTNNTASNVGQSEDFDLVECVAETIPVAVKMKQANFEHPSTSATTILPTFKVFNHPDAVPQISTTMFILPNYIVSQEGNTANLQSNSKGSNNPAIQPGRPMDHQDNRSLALTDVNTPGPDSTLFPRGTAPCGGFNFLSWQPSPMASTLTVSGIGPLAMDQQIQHKMATLRRNQSSKMPETANEHKICQHDSFLWLGLKIGVM
ncbi:uncharacterized protein LOC129751676 isoform X2 [Uranotaenia lowii]|uniref:uncharacterized protein LOC129751676 isoform X2 n=1 Tax=Uranotaenia lowii TaxID=190385 RepID=UPI0024783692|nr:uncharacterized protein LOC129751676 isoform X2 [Uranotaenia lowii]